MFKVKDPDEAQAVASDMCRRYPGLVQEVGPGASARDVAVKILLRELQSGSPSMSKLSPPRPGAASTQGGTSPGGTSLQGGDGGRLDVTGIPYDSSPGQSPSKGQEAQQVDSTGSKVEPCPYCPEPGSRYCKETGRRHETPAAKTLRQWKTIYRQLAMASQFVNTARLGKANTCVESDAIELDLDSF